MCKITRRDYFYIVVVLTIILILTIFLFAYMYAPKVATSSSGYVILGDIDEIDITHCSIKTEYWKDNIKENISGFNKSVDAIRYIVNATVKNKLTTKRLNNVIINVDFYGKKTYVGTRSYTIPILPKNYTKNITVNFLKEEDYFKNVTDIKFYVYKSN